MIKNYFKIAVRNFRHNKWFSLINVLGLSIGISASLVIFMIAYYDFSFDKFEKDGNHIYRIVTDMNMAGSTNKYAGVPSPLQEAVKAEISGLEETVGFHQFNDGGLKVSIPHTQNAKPTIFKYQGNSIFADSHYFNMIPYQWLAGSPETSLIEPNQLVLTEQKARLYFPDKNLNDIIGKEVIFDDSIRTTVTGIVKDLTLNTDFIFKLFVSQSTLQSTGLKNLYSMSEWGSVNSGTQLYVKLKLTTTPASVETQLKSVLKKYNPDANVKNKNATVFQLQPLSDIHFNGNYGNYGDRQADKSTLYGLLAVAGFLLTLACINFINLTTAQGAQRAKEIGIRKTMGGSRSNLVFQFLNETFFITLIATLLSLVLAPVLLNIFSDFIPADLKMDLLHQPSLIIFLIVLLIVVTLLSGFYPALILSKYRPVMILKNQAYSGTGRTRKAFLRKGLTISQFFIAQVFVMATLISVKQIHFVLNKDMGFKKDAIVTIFIPYNWNQNQTDNRRKVLLNELKRFSGIQKISQSNNPPSSNNRISQLLFFKDGKKEIETEVQIKEGDSNYLSLFNIHLLAGRNVQPSDTNREYIVNETYMHILGFQNPETILNKGISNNPNGGAMRPIVGVMADFNQVSLHEPVAPLVYSSNNNNSYVFNLLLKSPVAGAATWKSTINQVEKSFKKVYPEDDFNFNFFEESIAKYYKSEQDISRLLSWATGLAIFISCMGLLGLVMYTTNLRTKEIGVRKVLGASVTNLVSILSKDFILLVFIAFLIAAPVSWWAMNKWLDNFAYRTPINWWIFAASGFFMMLIALITLSIQTIRAASANPVESLRTE